MAFVKDDHSYTRGVGAVAAMDAASPRRRLAAARAARAMARRDAVMALGATKSKSASLFTALPSTAVFQTSTSTRKTMTPRQPEPGSEDWRKPRPPRPTGLSRPRIPAIVRSDRAALVKLPGTVIDTPSDGSKPTQGTTSTAAPTKTVVVGGGSGTSWTAPSSRSAPAAPDNPPPDFAPEPEQAVAPAVPAEKPQSKALLYAALGIGAWWLLTRE